MDQSYMGESALNKLQDYITTVNSTEYNLDASRGDQSYRAGLEKTLNSLKEQCNVERTKSERLRSDIDAPLWNEASPNAAIRLQQLQVITAGFRSLAQSDPQLPMAGSHLPALLATRECQGIISETKDSVILTHTTLKTARGDLSAEQRDLSDASLFTTALEDRIGKLRGAVSQRAKRSAEEAAQVLLSEEKEQAQLLKRSHKKLTNALVRFVDSKLAPLIAAEELGGPVAGSTLDVSEDVLASGFNVRGRPNKSKKKMSQNARQKRIDQMFTSTGMQEDEGVPETEATQAALAVKDLLGELLETAIDQGSGRYVTIEKETAASRFLVRARVAVLDPRDAKRIRMVNFAKTLDD